ncbi:MAG: hypothetical protein H7X71_05215 [Chitinophagales bacterium]|nr:hypothetical protein [Chitinophagales bacterium]
MDTQIVKKSLLNNQERIVGTLTGIVLIAGVGYVLYRILPFIVSILENTLYSILLLVAIIAVVTFLWTSRKLIWVAYQLFVQKLWRALANTDPIGIMKISLRKWIRKRGELENRITELQSAKEELSFVMEENREGANQSFKEALKAQEKGYKEQAVIKSVSANRRKLSNEQLLPRFQAIDKALGFLKRLSDRWKVEIELLDEDIQMRERDLKILKKTASALKSAQSVLEGNPDDLAMQQLAVQAYAQQVSENVANISRFMEKGKNWMYSADIQEAIMTDEGMVLLESYNEQTFKQLTDFNHKLQLPIASELSKSSQDVMEAFKHLK